MKILAIDIGNTSTHYGLVKKGKVSLTGDVPTKDLQDLLPIAFESLDFDGIAYCSVVPLATEKLEAVLDNLSAEVSAFHLTHDNCPGLPIHYPKPAEIGQDRLANAIGAQTLYGVPSVVIDMGTAVTFDIVTEHGYEGGIIAPGLAVMTKYLHEQTALLPSLNPDDLLGAHGIGKSTIEAMKIGCAVGFSGMIRALMETVESSLANKGIGQPKWIGAGGTAKILLKQAVPEIELAPEITLLGLAEAFRRNQS